MQKWLYILIILCLVSAQGKAQAGSEPEGGGGEAQGEGLESQAETGCRYAGNWYAVGGKIYRFYTLQINKLINKLIN